MRSAQQVAKRAVVMTTLAFRASLEVTDHPRSEELAGRLLPWLDEQDISDELDPLEREMLEIAYHKLHPSQLRDATFASEGACFFAWALGLNNPPPRTEAADSSKLINQLGILRGEVNKIVAAASLRSEVELRSYCIEILLTQSMMRESRLSERAAQAIVRQVEDRRLHELGLLPTDACRARCTELADSLSADQLRAAPGFYFVRSVAATWLFDNRDRYLES